MSVLAGKTVVRMNGGAPNMAGSDSNVSRMKKMRSGGRDYVYVSAQAYRRWLRDTLTREGFDPSPVVRSGSGTKQQVSTSGRPDLHVDDDLFGFMVAVKKDSTYRKSPFQTSPLVSISPAAVTEDFGTMNRGLHADEHPVLHAHEMAMTDLASDWLFDVEQVGRFAVDPNGLRVELLGKNLEAAEKSRLERGTFRGFESLELPTGQRRERAAALLRSMASVSGGANTALNYGSRTPTLIVFAAMKGGVNPFGHVVTGDRKGNTQFRFDVLDAEVTAWGDEMDSPVYVGWQPGYLDEQREQAEDTFSGLDSTADVVMDHPRTVLMHVAEQIEKGECDGWL